MKMGIGVLRLRQSARFASVLATLSMTIYCGITWVSRLEVAVSAWAAGKKCGAEIGDPNLRFQPRLPGSVVGEASMGQTEKGDKITRVTVLW
jgi:hypothetical protein